MQCLRKQPLALLIFAPFPLQAALGGSPSRLGLVNAFLRVKEKDRGALDFDQVGAAPPDQPGHCQHPGWVPRAYLAMSAPLSNRLPTWPSACAHIVCQSNLCSSWQPGGMDTTWMRIYCCLRAGFHAEAAQVGMGRRSTELVLVQAGQAATRGQQTLGCARD